ncbi:hypothetical protein CDAR_454141 [Caerostris darwini]|uniref:Uncharacterized protein n=1 Tax=Caerostris darwini TaxID=1538125 RepID=A0AAV4V7J8_9ARAC|nr:hypothetical protein CDAR_454141 [Caerostris darwini]
MAIKVLEGRTPIKAFTVTVRRSESDVKKKSCPGNFIPSRSGCGLIFIFKASHRDQKYALFVCIPLSLQEWLKIIMCPGFQLSCPTATFLLPLHLSRSFIIYHLFLRRPMIPGLPEFPDKNPSDFMRTAKRNSSEQIYLLGHLVSLSFLEFHIVKAKFRRILQL